MQQKKRFFHDQCDFLGYTNYYKKKATGDDQCDFFGIPTHTNKIDISHFKSGMYFIKINSNQAIKFIKQ